VLIWAIFIGWASFFHCGGKEAGLKNSAIANIWGAICAAVALIAAVALGGSVVTIAIAVGITVAIMILGAKVPALSAIPAAVYGYAATAALFIHGAANYGGGQGGTVKLALAIAISMVIGNILGLISEKIAGSLVKA
jgi:hypothetical protein